jgi:hypothetical protein
MTGLPWFLWLAIALFVLVIAFVVLAVPFGPAQPLWMDIRDWLVRRVRLWP